MIDNEVNMYSDWLKGTWKLDRFMATDEEGETIDVMGAGATGFICYSGDGWVSVQIVKPDRMRYDIPDVEGGTTEQRGRFGELTLPTAKAGALRHFW